MLAVDLRLQSINHLLSLQLNDDQIATEFNAGQVELVNAENYLTSKVLEWSFSKRREANEQHFGGIAATDESIAQLDELESQIGNCVKLLYQLCRLAERCQYAEVRQAGQNNLLRLPKFVEQTIVVSKLTTQIMRKEKRFEAALRILAAPALFQCFGGGLISVDHRLFNQIDLHHVLFDDIIAVQPQVNAAATLVTMKQKAKERGAIARHQDTNGRWHFTLKPNMTRRRRNASESGSDASSVDSARNNRAKNLANDPAVTATKAALVFDVQIKINVPDLTWNFLVTSIPIVLITHATQELASWCTVFWDNAFSCKMRKPFDVPGQVDSVTFLSGLQRWFRGRTGQYLLQQQLVFLQSCLPQLVTVKSLQETLNLNEELQFPFWPWFYKCTTLIEKEHELRKFCGRGFLHGFFSLQQTRLLLSENPGSAVLRFCTKEKKGAISIFRRRELSPPYGGHYVLERLGCWKLKHFKVHGFFSTLYDLEVREIAQVGNWLDVMRIKPEELKQKAGELCLSTDDGFVDVPIHICRACELQFV